MISIIIPVLKRDAFLDACLESVGSDPDVQVIVVEGVSPVGEARNRGLSQVCGEWVMFVDGDDVLAEGWLQVVKEMMRRHPDAELIGFGATQDLPLEKCVLNGSELFDLSKTLPTPVVERLMCQLVYRKELLRGLVFSDLVRGEDRLFMGEALLKAKRAAICDSVIYGYRQHEGSAMHRVGNEQDLRDEVEWRVRWAREVCTSEKTLTSRSWRNLGLYLLEYSDHQLRQIGDRGASERLSAFWFDRLGECSGMEFRPWQRVAMRLLSMTRSRLLTWALCRVPFCVKCLLHR